MLDYLQIFPNTMDLIKRYKPADRCLLYEAMMDYAFTGNMPDWEEDDVKWYGWDALQQYVDRANTAKQNAQKAGRASAEQRKATQVNANQQDATQGNTNQQDATQANASQQEATQVNLKPKDKDKPKDKPKPESKKEIPAQARQTARVSLDLFNRFWEAYPRKIAKQDAVRAWGKLKADEDLLRTILTAIERQKASPQWQKDNGEFIPHPATWLNGHRWEDEVSTRRDRMDQLMQDIEGGKYRDA